MPRHLRQVAASYFNSGKKGRLLRVCIGHMRDFSAVAFTEASIKGVNDSGFIGTGEREVGFADETGLWRGFGGGGARGRSG
jgi:hypothetical protein